MNQEFECIKIKDGLYLGNIVAAHDYQFLLSNKFGFVVNCTAEIPNVFEHENIRYLKFKLVEKKPLKLWDESLKKLNKLQKFLQQAEQTSLCCLIHSFHGQNRSLVFIAGYLMKKYQWRLRKCLQFLKSKQIFIGLSNHYISQLEILEQILSKNAILSSAWTPPYINEQQEIISKTYLNSLQGKEIKSELSQSKKDQTEDSESKKKPERRVAWLDRIQKKKKKEQISQKKLQQMNKIKEKAATHIETVKYRIPEYDMRDPELIKKLQYNSHKKLNSNEIISKKKDNAKKQKNVVTFEGVAEQENPPINSDQISVQLPPSDKIYQLTINNFISPSFNIINKTEPIAKKPKKTQQKLKKQLKQKKQQKSQTLNEKVKKVRPTSASKKSSQKINRAQSQKQVGGLKGLKENREQFKQIKQTLKQDENVAQSRQTQQIKQVKQMNEKKRDVKKELKKQIEKVEKQKSSHSSLHLLYPLSTLAHQLIKNQQGNVKRSSTPTRKQRKKQVTR